MLDEIRIDMDRWPYFELVFEVDYIVTDDRFDTGLGYSHDPGQGIEVNSITLTGYSCDFCINEATPKRKYESIISRYEEEINKKLYDLL